MRTKAGIILQARFASARLPGKALQPVGGRTILMQCLRRLIAGGVARVVLATTNRTEDDSLAGIAERLGVSVYRGDRDDVLGRFIGAAHAFDLDPIIRATGDNPGVDIQAPGRVLAALRETSADYACEYGLPCGAGVEGLTAAALDRAGAQAHSAHDREHVTTFIKSHPELFHLAVRPAPVTLTRPALRLSVDTADDLAWVRELFFRAGTDDPSLAKLIAASGRAQQAVA